MRAGAQSPEAPSRLPSRAGTVYTAFIRLSGNSARILIRSRLCMSAHETSGWQRNGYGSPGLGAAVDPGSFPAWPGFHRSADSRRALFDFGRLDGPAWTDVLGGADRAVPSGRTLSEIICEIILTIVRSSDERYSIYCTWHRLFCCGLPLPVCLRPPVRFAMSFELILGGVIAVGMLVYLTFALLRPEKF